MYVELSMKYRLSDENISTLVKRGRCQSEKIVWAIQISVAEEANHDQATEMVIDDEVEVEVEVEAEAEVATEVEMVEADDEVVDDEVVDDQDLKRSVVMDMMMMVIDS